MSKILHRSVNRHETISRELSISNLEASICRDSEVLPSYNKYIRLSNISVRIKDLNKFNKSGLRTNMIKDDTIAFYNFVTSIERFKHSSKEEFKD